MDGVYLRNGPNAKFHADSGRGHFFDGDSMIHGIRIKNGKAYYCNRMTQTNHLKAEIEQEGPCFIRIGELVNLSGVLKMAMLAIK